MDENRPVLWLVQRIGSALFDGWGGVNVMAIRGMLDLHGLDQQRARGCMTKILTYCNALAKARNTKKATNGWPKSHHHDTGAG